MAKVGGMLINVVSQLMSCSWFTKYFQNTIGRAVLHLDGKLQESDWKRAEYLLHSGEKSEMELISCSSRGFVVSLPELCESMYLFKKSFFIRY